MLLIISKHWPVLSAPPHRTPFPPTAQTQQAGLQPLFTFPSASLIFPKAPGHLLCFLLHLSVLLPTPKNLLLTISFHLIIPNRNEFNVHEAKFSQVQIKALY